MRSVMKISIAAAAIAGLAILPGCEDSPLYPGEDYTMTLISQPSTVPFDEEATVTITATVLNADYVPQPGITVFFSNSDGTLAPASGGVNTNSGGIATATLTLEAENAADATDVEVTATSAQLSETVVITRSGVPANRPPTAVIEANPVLEQVQNGTVEFFGDLSTDPDDDDIVRYKWELRSDNPDTASPPLLAKPNPIVLEGDGLTAISIPNETYTAYRNVQHLTVTLTVTDSRGKTGSTIFPYEIVAP